MGSQRVIGSGRSSILPVSQPCPASTGTVSRVAKYATPVRCICTTVSAGKKVSTLHPRASKMGIKAQKEGLFARCEILALPKNA